MPNDQVSTSITVRKCRLICLTLRNLILIDWSWLIKWGMLQVSSQSWIQIWNWFPTKENRQLLQIWLYYLNMFRLDGIMPRKMIWNKCYKEENIKSFLATIHTFYSQNMLKLQRARSYSNLTLTVCLKCLPRPVTTR